MCGGGRGGREVGMRRGSGAIPCEIYNTDP